MMYQKVLIILKNYLSGSAGATDMARVEKWYESAEKNNLLSEIENEHLLMRKEMSYLKIRASIERENSDKVFHLTKKILLRMSAAAAILLVVGIGIYKYYPGSSKSGNAVVKSLTVDDIPAPVLNRASITLANGQQIMLDSLGSTVLSQGKVDIIRDPGGEIVYKGNSDELLYNSLYNPRGSTVVRLVLTDGTRVWLNSGSSLKYPVAFSPGERKVQVSGEVYFEVAPDKTRAFSVVSGDVVTQVLGTRFNVKNYEEDKETKITLLQGSVRVKDTRHSDILLPGDQILVNEKWSINNSVDIEEVMAWKNGKFHFDNASFSTIINEIARWYGVEVVYEGTIPERRFTGKANRNISLNNVLKILEWSGVSFKTEANKVIIY